MFEQRLNQMHVYGKSGTRYTSLSYSRLREVRGHRGDMEAAHKAHYGAAPAVGARCGCFFCGESFLGETIKEWTGGPASLRRPLCPRCSLPSVLSESFAPITEEFLQLMYDYWFARASRFRFKFGK